MKHWLFAPLVIFTGCCTNMHRVVVKPRPITIAQEFVQDSVRYPEVIKQYHLGRRIDPHNEAVMHEAHPFFRVESQTHWNLHPISGAMPTISIQSLLNPASAGVALNDETVAELNRQKEITRTVMQQADSLGSTLQGLSSALTATRSLAEQNRMLREQIASALQRVEALELQSHQRSPSSNPKDSGF